MVDLWFVCWFGLVALILLLIFVVCWLFVVWWCLFKCVCLVVVTLYGCWFAYCGLGVVVAAVLFVRFELVVVWLLLGWFGDLLIVIDFLFWCWVCCLLPVFCLGCFVW